MTNFEIHCFKSRHGDWWSCRVTFRDNNGVERSIIDNDGFSKYVSERIQTIYEWLVVPYL